MLKQQGTSRHMVYFQRNFLQQDEYDRRIRKRKVTFGGLRQSSQEEPEKFVIWQKGSGYRYNIVFKPDEFCAMDILEQRLAAPGGICDCLLGKYNNYRLYHSLYILLVRDNHQTILQLLEPVNIYHSKMLQGQKINEPAVMSLQKVIKEHIGSFDQWLVDVRKCRGLQKDTKVLLSNTKYCFSVLREDFVMMSSHLYKENNFHCDFNAETGILQIEISQKLTQVELNQNFQLSNTYVFRTNEGAEIKSQINENWKVHEDLLPRSTTTSLETNLNAVPNFPDHTVGSTLSSNGHATMIVDKAEINQTPSRIHVSKIQQSADEMQNPPPPSPCLGAEPSPNIAGLVPEQGISISKDARICLRSISFPDLLTEEKFKDHIYVNESIESWEEHCKNGIEEPVYYRFYYNLGYVQSNQSASMRTKLKRRSAVSDLMGKVDFEVLAKHESWYDSCIAKSKRDTMKRERTVKDKPESDWGEKRSKGNTRKDRSFYSTSDDSNKFVPDEKLTYWNSDLCLTLQMILEKRKPDLCRTFDLTFNQLKGVVFYMCLLTKASKDWKDLAVLLDLSNSDINIIENFSYHCPIGVCGSGMSMEVLMIHWKFLDNKGRNIIACNRSNLEQLLTKIGRLDVLNILHEPDTNEHIQSEEEFLVTHF